MFDITDPAQLGMDASRLKRKTRPERKGDNMAAFFSLTFSSFQNAWGGPQSAQREMAYA